MLSARDITPLHAVSTASSAEDTNNDSLSISGHGLAMGFVTLALIGSAVWAFGLISWGLAASLPVLGGMVGHVVQLRRIHAAQRSRSRSRPASQGVGLEHQPQLNSFEQRQRAWVETMEAESQVKAQAVKQVSDVLHAHHQDSGSELRPFRTLRSGARWFIQQGIEDAESWVKALDEVEATLDLIPSPSELNDEPRLNLRHEILDVTQLTEQVRHRLRGQTEGKNVRVSVFRTREAPEKITCDRRLMDRVIDAMVANAVEQTDRGSILVQVGRSGDFLTLEMSDTGSGLQTQDLNCILDAQRDGVVEGGLHFLRMLVDNIGGRLELMSHLGKGTTVRVQFPAKQSPQAEAGLYLLPAVDAERSRATA